MTFFQLVKTNFFQVFKDFSGKDTVFTGLALQKEHIKHFIAPAAAVIRSVQLVREIKSVFLRQNDDEQKKHKIFLFALDN